MSADGRAKVSSLRTTNVSAWPPQSWRRLVASGIAVLLALSVQPEVKNDPEYGAAGDEETPVLFDVLEPKKLRIGDAARASHIADPPIGAS